MARPQGVTWYRLTQKHECMNTTLNLSKAMPNYATILIHMLKVVRKTFDDNHRPKYSTIKMHETLIIK